MCPAATAPATLRDTLRHAVHPLTGDASDYDPLLERIGDARVVLLGEATHGTHEFYRERARITRRLIEEKGFTVVAVEADWPDAYRVNRWVRGMTEDGTAEEALGGFRRFPTWMWRNADVLALIEWLREHNAGVPEDRPKVGFYGRDLYSLFTSIEAVLGYLEEVDPEAARRARYRYACFDHFGEDTQAYGYAAERGITRSCEDEVVQQLAVRLPAPAGRRRRRRAPREAAGARHRRHLQTRERTGQPLLQRRAERAVRRSGALGPDPRRGAAGADQRMGGGGRSAGNVPDRHVTKYHRPIWTRQPERKTPS